MTSLTLDEYAKLKREGKLKGVNVVKTVVSGGRQYSKGSQEVYLYGGKVNKV